MNLLKKIHAKVKQNKYITFDDYMDICLYYPDYGYYNNKNISLDPTNSDFITGPELSSLYTDSLIDFYIKYKKFHTVENVIEIGAGSGAMAYNFLYNMPKKDIPKKYYILERSKYLKKQQKEKLSKLPKEYFEIIEWIDEIKYIENVFLVANEVLDALPAKIFIKENNFFYEKVIKLKNNKLYFSKINCNDFLLDKIYRIEKRIKSKIPNNYIFELNILYENFLTEIFNNIKNFMFIIIDYGYGEKEFYHPDRINGTIQFYKNHKKVSNCLIDQGNFDISISVDFSRVKRICKSKDVQLLSYTTQTEFLLNTNILENSKKILDSYNKSNILKTLLFPSDMGENFKIMLLCDDINKNFNSPFKDYRHKL